MGQRTQMVIRINNAQTKTTTTDVYHHQFGFGKVLPTDFMSIVLQTAYKGGDDWKLNFHGTNMRYLCDVGEIETLNMLNLWDLDVLQEALVLFDNNNGFMIVEIQLGEYGYFSSAKIGFLSGLEDDKEHHGEKWLSLEEYSKPFQKYVPQEFIELFNNFTKFYDVETVE